ncbi:DUF4189 domain-containing protein [Rhizobium sp. LjRoot254]|uniref:DUF4189 domain-containing protein n=1 Tax=Rhizobium sp. LjRoot254 TaxID=3342297 RepID=UPI003ECD6E77
MRKLILACFAIGAVGVATSGEALAWGCVAVDSQGAYGYSNDWPSEQDAELTALKQCDKYTKTNDCQTESCDHDAGG